MTHLDIFIIYILGMLEMRRKSPLAYKQEKMNSFFIARNNEKLGFIVEIK
jgi:hypothetical protein